ncbi:hypothetical protein ACLB2K_045222 [Fragaria x ananassa]
MEECDEDATGFGGGGGGGGEEEVELTVPRGSSQFCEEEDISVDELKILSEEELVEMAIKELLKVIWCFMLLDI